MSVSSAHLGLKENWKQFTLLVLVNALVGGMLGMERTIIPEFAETKFEISSAFAILSFITVFGLAKAISNYYTGRLANLFGRRNLLLAGWLIAIPIPFMLIYAKSWVWVLVANMFLGISQGLTWSSTVVMKIDIVGERNRGLAMGLNEFAGYFAVGVVAYITGFVATKYGIWPYPFYIGIGISVIGFFLTLFYIKDTIKFVKKENEIYIGKELKNVFIETTFSDKTLSSVTQAGLVNNLNDGMIWGLLPILLFSMDFEAEEVGLITAIYPTLWGVGQLFTGKMADYYSKKFMIFWGMLCQGVSIILMSFLLNFTWLLLLSIFLGLGTALVYPTFLSAIAMATKPVQRAESIGTFRLWRDLGYVFGAVLSGILADILGFQVAIFFIGFLTLISSIIVFIRMPNDTRKRNKVKVSSQEKTPV